MTSFFIAQRYFKSRKKRSFINVISAIAMLGVGIGTMALVVVMSVFNGMEDLNRQVFKSFDADLKVMPAMGKRITINEANLLRIKNIESVSQFVEVIEDNALAVYGDTRMVVKIKGVSQGFLQTEMLKNAMIEGERKLIHQNHGYAIVGSEIQSSLGISTKNIFTPLELWYPNNDFKTLNMSNPDAFNQQALGVGGVFMLDARYDNYIFTPIETTRALLGYADNQFSALEITLKPTANADETKEQLENILSKNFVVLTRDEQNVDLLRAIRIEKLFVIVTLGLIVLVAAVNIFFSLSMLVLEKKQEISMLRAMGATSAFIKQIFMFDGALIAFTGATVGLILGVGLCLVQQHFGIVSLGLANAIVDAYPVKLIWNDLFLTVVIVVVVTLVVSYLPAKRATVI